MIWAAWRQRRNCMHHDDGTGESWIRHELIDVGARKRFWCRKCGRMWFV
jgi:hypothetical protein